MALGSNVSSAIGGSPQIIRTALEAIRSESVDVVAESSLYRTPCMPRGAGPDYINAVVLLETGLAASALLDHLHDIEYRFERTREVRWGARTLDLDLLDFGGTVAPDEKTWKTWCDLPFERQRTETPAELILPHPRLQDRAFVLVPLAEIAPGWSHPVTGKPIDAMLGDLDQQELNAIAALGASEGLRSAARDDK